MSTKNGRAASPAGGTPISRRTVARGAAWTAPLIAGVSAAPAFATSSDPSCWDSITVGRLDIRFVGPINTTNNAMIKSSTDGTCAGSDAGVATVVQAANYDAARDMCETVGNTLSVQRLFDIGYKSVPFDHYICAPP